MDICVICQKNSSNYKCPKCRIKYCSSICYKEHEKINCNIVNKCDKVPEENNEYSHITEDTIPEDKLKLLENNEALQSILKNKHVRDILLEIDKNENASAIMDRAMKEPIFVEFADACLKAIQKEN